MLKVRLYRPFSAKHLLQALPDSVRIVAVLDRTKEPVRKRNPVPDVMTALAEAFNNGERETLPVSLVGAMVFHPKNLARTVYWRYLPSSTRLNRKRALRLVFTMM
ncbi:hypothetical protein DMI66_00815 [Escherichia coli]|nr:hypothetical protein [Escherichia coli]